MWLAATLSISTGLQYFLFPYLLFLHPKRGTLLFRWKVTHLHLLLEQSSLEFSSVEPLLAGVFLIFSLSWPLSTHSEHTCFSFILGRKNLPCDCASLSRSPCFFPLLPHSWRVFYAWCFLFITAYLSLKPYAQITSELVVPHLLASFSFYLIFVTFDIVTILFIKLAPP